MMIGIKIRTPINKNCKLFLGAAACQISSPGGTMLG